MTRVSVSQEACGNRVPPCARGTSCRSGTSFVYRRGVQPSGYFDQATAGTKEEGASESRALVRVTDGYSSRTDSSLYPRGLI